MSKVTITFLLPEEQEDYQITMQAHDMYCAISDFDNELRRIIKYADPKTKEDKMRVAIAEEFRGMFNEFLRSRKVEL